MSTIIMRRPPITPATLLFILVCLAAGTCAAKDYALKKERRYHAAAALAADTLAATRDTTRRLALGLDVLAKGTQALQRRSVQVEQHADSIDKALRAERVAKAGVTAVLARLQANATAIARDSGEYRIASFAVERSGYSVQADIEVPAPPGKAKLYLDVQLDTLRLEYRLHCKVPDEHGIRPATLTVFGPDWIKLTVDRMEQSPDVCRSPALLPPRDGRSWWRRTIDRLGINAGYGGVVDNDGRVVRGPGVMLSARVWP